MPKWYGGSTLNPDELIPKNRQWEIQWERLNRWYERVKQTQEKSMHSNLDLWDIDIIIAFFQNCCHLRDWLNASRPELWRPIENLLGQSFEMGACRDICNGFKHKTLSRPTHDADFNLYREYDHLEEEAGTGINPTNTGSLLHIKMMSRNSISFNLLMPVTLNGEIFLFKTICFRIPNHRNYRGYAKILAGRAGNGMKA